jgi:hypothetical protein
LYYCATESCSLEKIPLTPARASQQYRLMVSARFSGIFLAPGFSRRGTRFSFSVEYSALQRGFPTCFSLVFDPSFAEAGREARLKPALFLREHSLSPTG